MLRYAGGSIETPWCLNSTLQRVYSCSILPSHPPLQLDCFAFSIQPHSSERAHILKCREMWKWNLPDAAVCDITNFYWPHTLTPFLTLTVALQGSNIDTRVKTSRRSWAFSSWLLINKPKQGDFPVTVRLRNTGSLLSDVVIPVSDNKKLFSHNWFICRWRKIEKKKKQQQNLEVPWRCRAERPTHIVSDEFGSVQEQSRLTLMFNGNV